MNTEFIELLVKCVESYPCIWDPTNASYNKREFTEVAWEDISKICGHSGKEKYCREKWKNVRTGFLRSVAKRKRFYLFEAMKFLLPILSVRHIESSTSQSQSQSLLHEQPIMNHNFKDNSVGNEYNSLCENLVQKEDSSVSDGASLEASVCDALNDLENAKVDTSDEYKSLCDNVVQIEDSSISATSLETSVCEQLDDLENAKVDTTSTTTPSIGYFSQLISESRATNCQNYSENKNSEISYSSRKRKHSDDDDELNKETKAEKALMSFFKGISADILSLSIQNQRFFKRKIVELIDDLHGSEDKTKEITFQS